MNQIQTELPMLRHAGAVIEYTVHEDDLEERDFPPIQDRTWGPIPPLAGSIDIGLLCRREPGPICFRASGNIATLFLSIGKALLDLLKTDAGNCISRLEIRPLSRPPKS